MNVLIVEDEPQVAKYLTRLIVSTGHQVQAAISCRQTLDLVEHKLFDLVILDIFLPDGQGHDIIPKIRAMRPKINIIAMTGQNNRELEQKVREKGVLFYMIKPIDVRHLKSILEHLDRKLKET